MAGVALLILILALVLFLKNNIDAREKREQILEKARAAKARKRKEAEKDIKKEFKELINLDNNASTKEEIEQ